MGKRERDGENEQRQLENKRRVNKGVESVFLSGDQILLRSSAVQFILNERRIWECLFKIPFMPACNMIYLPNVA